MRNARGVFLRSDAVEPYSLSNQHGDAFRLHLAHDLHAVAFDRAGADREPFRDGFARVALHDQVEDLHFARRQPVEAKAKVLNSVLGASLLVSTREAAVDRRNELNVVEMTTTGSGI